MINAQNYFSDENNRKYWSYSQFKDFMSCEAGELAKIEGEYSTPSSVALLVGGYVDAYFERSLDGYRGLHPELFTKQGDLKKDFKQAEYIIQRIKADPMMMKFLSGKQQVIKTGELFGVDWKIKIDSYHEGEMIVDLKVMKDFEDIYIPERGRLNFIEAWRYDLQLALYQAIEGNNLPVYIAGATKQKDGADIEIFQIPQYKLDNALKLIEAYIEHFDLVKKKIIPPKRCGKCAYCRSTKVLDSVTVLGEAENE